MYYLYTHISTPLIHNKHEKQFPHVNRVFDFTDKKNLMKNITMSVCLTRVYSNIILYYII